MKNDEFKAVAFLMFAYGGLILSMYAFGVKLKADSEQRIENDCLNNEKIRLEIQVLKSETQSE